MAIKLALGGFQVDCVCYSTYLSQRDYENFKKIFRMLDVSSFIQYKTIIQACKDFSKSKDIEEAVRKIFYLNRKFLKGEEERFAQEPPSF